MVPVSEASAVQLSPLLVSRAPRAPRKTVSMLTLKHSLLSGLQTCATVLAVMLGFAHPTSVPIAYKLPYWGHSWE